MSSTVKMDALVDVAGRILAASLPNDARASKTKDGPESRVEPVGGQRIVSFDVPREVLELPGPDLQRFLSEVRVGLSGEVSLPKITIVKGHEH